MNRFNRFLSIPVMALTALALSGCGLEQASSSYVPTKFLTSTGVDSSSRISRLPFEHSWRDPKVDIKKYKYIVVRPVTTQYVDASKWEDSKSALIPDKRTYLRRCAALARYWDKSLNRAFTSPVCIYYKTNSTAQSGTLILNVALTEIRFDPNPTPADAPNADGNVTDLLTGLPTCTFEAKVTDASSGALVSTAADRRVPTLKVVDNKKSNSPRPTETICDEWSTQLMEASNIELFPTVKRNWFSFF